MMDIVERLRREEDALDNEAADEIERLREACHRHLDIENTLIQNNMRLREALDILQAAMVEKKPIPLRFKKAILDARSALQQKDSE